MKLLMLILAGTVTVMVLAYGYLTGPLLGAANLIVLLLLALLVWRFYVVMERAHGNRR